MTSPNLHSPAMVDPEIQHGQPVLPGTRIPIAIIIGSLASGMTYEEVMVEYVVSKEQILTASTHFRY